MEALGLTPLDFVALAVLVFTAITMLWAPMVLQLSGPPWLLSHTEVGLFGIAGAVGAVGAAFAGNLADRGLAERVTGAGLVLMLIAWAPIALLDRSLFWLLLGVLIIDFALQGVHVSNQALLHLSGAGARGWLTAGYMLLYSAGSAIGSITSTLIFDAAGWLGVCVAGAMTGACALGFWLIMKRPGCVET